MRTLSTFALLIPLGVVACGGAAMPPSQTGQVLPLRALRLYETGVGYFERSGEVRPGEASSLPVPAGHLDDALKSLVVLNGGAGGEVTGLSFSSRVSRGVARARAGLPVDNNQPITYRELLVSLKGERLVATTSGGSVTGRLIEVLEEPSDAPAAAPATAKSEGADANAKPRSKDVLVITLLSDNGELVKLRGFDLLRVRPVDPAFAARLERALDALSMRSAQISRPLSLLGDVRGKVTFGYIAETPIWRTTYRLITAKDGTSGTFQGWALLHNDTDETWQNVSLSLVNGEPDSFIFPLAAPRYQRRELVIPDEPLSTIPQLQDTTADALWGDHPGIRLGSIGSIGHGSGSGTGYGRGVSTRSAGRAAGISVGSSSLLSDGDLADVASAAGVENGALFTYTVAKPFSLGARSSALVPFLQKSLAVDPVAWFDSPTAQARSAVRFVNTTGQTLPAGTLAVFAAGGFAGESTLDRLKPGERRFVQFGNELDAEVTPKKGASKDETKRLTFNDLSGLEEHFFQTTELTYELENRASTPRALYVRLAMDENAKITGADGADFDEATRQPIAVFRLAPKQKSTRTFTAVEGLMRSTGLEVLTEKQLTELADKTSLPASEAAIAREAAQKMKDVVAMSKAVSAAEAEHDSATADAERFREHLKALGGDKGGVAAPLVARLLEAEDRLAAVKKRQAALKADEVSRLELVRLVLMRLGPG